MIECSRNREYWKKGLAMTATKTYLTLESAYQHFNKKLFGNMLPQCLITYTRRKKSYGYFSPDRMERVNAKGAEYCHEIALNPCHFKDRSLREVVSTLVHEMVHVWQEEFGTPSKTYSYHNKQWAEKMKEIGLYPSRTGKPGGAEVGPSCSHYIIEGGPFARSYDQLGDVVILYQDRAETGDEKKVRKAKAASKTKYSCPDCDTNAWAKPNAMLMCGYCNVNMQMGV